MRLASVLLAVYWVTIFVATHLPSAALPILELSDKVYHVAAFAGLAFLLGWALPKSRRGMSVHGATVVSVGGLYAIVDEWTQQFIPGRTCDPLDVAADILGLIVGFAVYVSLRAMCRRFAFLEKLVLSVSR